MRKAMLDAGLPEPTYDTEGMFTVTFRRPTKREKVLLTDVQARLIQVVKQKPFLTMEQIGKELGLGRTSVYKIVRGLRDLGLLEHIGRKNDGEWIVKHI